MPLIWTLQAEAANEDLQLISDAVFSHIRSQALPANPHPIACLVREGDRLIAGGSGRTEYQRLFVNFLWVAEEYRGQGMARRILQKLESEAGRRGCHDAMIETLDDSVAHLYVRFGYHLVARLPHFLGPFTRHTLLKTPLASWADSTWRS